MKRKTKWLFGVFIIIILIGGMFFLSKKINVNPTYSVGEKIDSLDGVYVFYNGGTDHILGRNTSKDGYNIGLQYQCVEFVKRYYYEHYKHKMPNSYGNAIDFFNPNLKDGEMNADRNLIQYSNSSTMQPRKGDLLIYSGTTGNKFGHVSIVSEVKDDEIEIIQQNPGQFAPSRIWFDLEYNKKKRWKIDNKRILGWLRKE